MSNIRNAHYNSCGTIDLEYEHPQYGWLPFTTGPDDPLGSELHALALQGNVAPVDANLVRATQVAAYKAAFDAHLDAVAQQRQYDNRLTIAAYTSSTNAAWAAEAQAFIAWRDGALSYMFEKLAAVEAGQIEPPTIEAFIAEMPAIEWPS